MPKAKRSKLYYRPVVNFSSFDDDDDDDESDNGLLRPCFQIGSDVELKEIPTSGEEYLLTVITERKNVLEVTKCDVDLTKFKHKQSLFAEEIPLKPVPPKLKPTIEWQNIQVDDFIDVRMSLTEIQSKIHKTKLKIENITMTNETFGRWLRFFNIKEPKLSCMLGLNQSQVEIGLERLTEVMERIPVGQHIMHKTGQWIYSFLACLRLPLLADSQSILRALARQCAEKRSQIDPDKEDAEQLAAPYNLFICLIAKYFGQTDLAD